MVTSWMLVAVMGMTSIGHTVVGPRISALRQICEEWRDYRYNPESGEFIEWAGEPYWVCHGANEPATRPGGADRDRYSGGFGEPQDQRAVRCQRCQLQYSKCMRGIDNGRDQCVKHYRGQAESWCVTYKRTQSGEFIRSEYSCTGVLDEWSQRKTHCEGPGIEDCIESYARDAPATKIENSRVMVFSPRHFGVRGEETITVSWGGSTGYMRACRIAAEQAAEPCLTDLLECQAMAGGCQ